MIEIQGQRDRPEGRAVEPLDADSTSPSRRPDSFRRQRVSGICRFFLQEVAPNFRLYVSPINMDPAAPAQKISEPESFIQDVAGGWGRSATTGFQEDYKARKNGDLLRRRVRPAGGHGPRRAARAVRLRRQQLRRRPALLLLLQQRPPVAHLLVGLGRQAPDPFRRPRRRRSSATSGGSTRSSTR